jgi:hypothetical protein
MPTLPGLPDPATWIYWVLDDSRNAIPVDIETGQQWRMTEERCRVDLTEFDNGEVEVSTVFVPRLATSAEHPPVNLFETHIIRNGRHQEFDLYHTWAAAEKGHQRAVDSVLAEGRVITWTYPQDVES